MLIVAFLPQPLLRHLRRVMTPDHDVVAVSGWNVLRDVVRTSGAEVAVVDPSTESTGPVPGVPSLGIDVVEFVAAIIPVVVYAVLTPRTARFMSHTNSSAVRQLVLHGIDDEPERLRQIIEGLGASEADTVLVRPIIAALSAAGAPIALGAAIRLLFRTPRRFRSAEDLAAASGLSRRWVNECLAAAGLAPARILVIAARVWRAYHDLQVPGTSVGTVAARLSYPDIKSFRRHARSCTGIPPSEWNARLTPDQCTSCLATLIGVPAQRPVALVRTSQSRDR
jgi:AraC-like DNA-binding protein